MPWFFVSYQVRFTSRFIPQITPVEAATGEEAVAKLRREARIVTGLDPEEFHSRFRAFKFHPVEMLEE
jgi:hypothetical protein